MSILSFIFRLILPASFLALAGTVASAQEVTECPTMPLQYVKLFNQPYALCAGATTYNYGLVTYAKCQRLRGNSISLEQSYPINDPEVLTTTKSGNIATMNAGSRAAKGYVMSTYSPPAGAILPKRDLAIYTCRGGGSYAQCDGGVCFNATSGKTGPLWGKVKKNEVICSCPVVESPDVFQVVGPGQCPTTAEAYDKICGKALASVDGNGAIHYIGAPTDHGYRALSACLTGTEPVFHTCSRPGNN